MRLWLVFVLFSGLFLILPEYSFAYIDPNTGSYFIQILVASLAGFLFSVRLYWQRIRDFIFRSRK